ncbi:MAG: class I SAM-dependent methyltransferase [Candidatus Heimdallarchaeota archaeon]|nr:class I SAM-dependent methyltransferase [Candidatus Heimdallarchaeota archaeon]
MSLRFFCEICYTEVEPSWEFTKAQSSRINEIKNIPIHCDQQMKLKIVKVETTKKQRYDAEQLDGDPIPFTSYLTAFHRFLETKTDSPLICDPYAEALSSHLEGYINYHRHFLENGYTVIRTNFIDNYLRKWLLQHQESQIILLGAGLDTRLYRIDELKKGKHLLIEVDFTEVLKFKASKMRDIVPNCRFIHFPLDIEKNGISSLLEKHLIKSEIPSLWIFEGLFYYLSRSVVFRLLSDIAKFSENIAVIGDHCVPIVAELKFGPFTQHFKWGISLEDIIPFFKDAGMDIKANFADEFALGRETTQKGQIFFWSK